MRIEGLDPTSEHHRNFPSTAAEEPTVRDVDLYTLPPSGAIPEFGFKQAPKGLATRRQLRAMNLSPGGHDPVAQLTWRNKKRRAWLYRIDLAKPKRVPTLAQEWALDRAMAARQSCPVCRVRFDICLPLKTLGSCFGCSAEAKSSRAA
jgi:hypothetical protein